MAAHEQPHPTRIDVYDIINAIATGGMGCVYLARDSRRRNMTPHDLVALKVIKADLAGERGYRAKFLSEIRNARRVHGPFTARIVAQGTCGNQIWYASEYIPGMTVEQMVADTPLSGGALLRLGIGACDGLLAVHAQGIVHRDLKPSNLMVDTLGRIRIIDFGVACEVDHTGGTTLGARIVGTPAFLAPEQGLGEDSTFASDVFSLAVLLFYAATRELLFNRKNAMATIQAVIRDHPDLTAAPPELRSLLRACLQKEPTARPSVAEVKARLEALLAEVSNADTQVIDPDQTGTTWLPEPLQETLRLIPEDPTRVITRPFPPPTLVDPAPRPAPRPPHPRPTPRRRRLGEVTALVLVFGLLAGIALAWPPLVHTLTENISFNPGKIFGPDPSKQASTTHGSGGSSQSTAPTAPTAPAAVNPPPPATQFRVAGSLGESVDLDRRNLYTVTSVRPSASTLEVRFKATINSVDPSIGNTCIRVKGPAGQFLLYPFAVKYTDLTKNRIMIEPHDYTGSLTYAAFYPGEYFFQGGCITQSSELKLGSSDAKIIGASGSTKSPEPGESAAVLAAQHNGNQLVLQIAAVSGWYYLQEPKESCLTVSGSQLKPQVKITSHRSTEMYHFWLATLTFTTPSGGSFAYGCTGFSPVAIA